MARAKGSMKLGENIEPQIGAPLDARTLVKTKADLTNPKSYEYAYVGMEVMVKDELKKYVLKAKDTTDENNWEPVGGGNIDPEQLEGLATKEELEDYATKEELESYATKEELDNYISSDDLNLNDYATKDDLNNYQTKAESANFVTSDNLNEFATKDDLANIQYSSIKGLPKINNKTIIGNISFSDLGLTVDEDGTAHLEELKIVTWANGTDKDVAKMVEAADNGDINLYDYWAIGDERIVQLSDIPYSSDLDNSQNEAQNICLVLVDTGDRLSEAYAGTKSSNYTFTHPVAGEQMYLLKKSFPSNRLYPWFIVAMKNNLMNTGKMTKEYKSDTASISWSSSDRRAWCNSTFRFAFSSELRPIFKEFLVFTYKKNSSLDLAGTYDYFPIFHHFELNPKPSITRGYQSYEYNFIQQFKYYADYAGRKFHKNGGVDVNADFSNNDSYWYRNPTFDADLKATSSFDGSSSGKTCNSSNGLSMFCAI